DERNRAYLISLLNDFIGSITQKVSDIIISLPQIILALFVTLFTTYYTLTEGKKGVSRIARIIPLRVHHQEQVIKQFGDVTYALIYGSFIVALVQGTLGAFGFWIFGIKGFLWWGIATTLFALVPFVGTAIVWVPMSLFLTLSGYVQGEIGLIWRGFGLFLYGLFVISTVDNILKPLIIAGRAKVHPLLVLLGVLGGLATFGLIGLIVGPFVLTGLQKMFEIYERESQPHLKESKACILGRENHIKKR
ncbi:AI-2E family transporter, partial [Candidatus Woesearchaeota archaeon]